MSACCSSFPNCECPDEIKYGFDNDKMKEFLNSMEESKKPELKSCVTHIAKQNGNFNNPDTWEQKRKTNE